MNSDGFSEFLKGPSSHGERLDQAMVAMESTGCYRINLFSFLHDKRLEKALLPCEKKLQRQERFRRILGVKEVEQPTYQRCPLTPPTRRGLRGTCRPPNSERKASLPKACPSRKHGNKFEQTKKRNKRQTVR